MLTWNSGDTDVNTSRNKIADVDFLKNVVVNIQKKVPINSDHFFVVGHSNGGRQQWRQDVPLTRARSGGRG